MANQLTNALVNAGFPHMPVNKRIWLWINDHPGKTTHDVSVALGISHATASATLSNLYERGMLGRVGVKRHTSHGSRATFEYTTCIDEYELLPRKHSTAKSTRGSAKSPSPVAAVAIGEKATHVTSGPKADAPAKIDINAIPLKEAFQLWADLCIYFGDQRAVSC